MKKQRLLAMLLAAALVLGCAACGSSGNPPAGSSGTPAASSSNSDASTGANATTVSPNPTGITLPEDGEVYKLDLASGYNPEAYSSKVISHLIEVVNEWSNGKIQITHYPANQLGSDREMFEAAQLGNIAMTGMVTAPQSTFIPMLAVFDMGGYSTDFDAAVATLASGDFRDRLEQEYENVGVKLMNIYPTGYRELETSQEIRSLEDIAGMKIRVMENPYHIAFWTALGANPTPLAYSELYISLQQGLVNAAENPIDTMFRDNTHEQCKYIVLTHHILFNNTITMNQSMWDAMPEDYQIILQAAMDEAAAWGIDNCNAALEEAMAGMEAKGLEIIELPDSELDRIREAAQPVYDQIRAAIGNEIVDLYINELAKN